MAVLYQNQFLVQELLSNEATPNAVETKRNTPLHLSMLLLKSNTPVSLDIIKRLISHTDITLLNEQGHNARDLLMVLWVQGYVTDDVKRAVDVLLTEKGEKEKERLRLDAHSKQNIFHHTISSVLTSYFDARRQEICGETPPRKNMVCFSNVVSLAGNVLSFSGANAITNIISSVASTIEDQLYLEKLDDDHKGLNGIEQMRHEVDKIAFTLFKRHEKSIKKLSDKGVAHFAYYTANRVKKYLNRGHYNTDDTFIAQLLNHFQHMPTTIDTFSHSMRVRILGEAYVATEHGSAPVTARYLLTHPSVQQEEIEQDDA